MRYRIFDIRTGDEMEPDDTGCANLDPEVLYRCFILRDDCGSDTTDPLVAILVSDAETIATYLATLEEWDESWL